MSSTTPSPTASPSAADNRIRTCTTAVPGQYGNVPVEACNSNYNFDPAFEPAVAVAILFGLLTLTHVILAIVFRKRYAWVLIMGAVWETLAFVFHSLGAHDQQNQGYAIGYVLLFLLAPLWVNAFVYMTFARTTYFFLPDRRVWKFRAEGMSKWFVWADVFTFIVQAVGGVMTTPGHDVSTVKAGLDVYIAGIALQELFILCFLALMVVFERKARALDRENLFTVHGEKIQTRPRGWRPPHYTLYTVLVFISLRICYRIAEFGGGLDPSKNPIPFNEVYSYTLDAFPMLACLLILAVMYPGRTLVGPNSSLPRRSRAEKKIEKQRKKERKAVEKVRRTDERSAIKMTSLESN